MYILLFIILLLLVLVYLIFTKPVAISFSLDTNSSQMHLSMLWLPPFLEITGEMVNAKPLLSVYLFNKCVKQKVLRLQRNKNKDRSMFKALSLQDTSVKTYYGLNSPFSMGILCGTVGFIKSLFHLDVLEQYPEFMPSNEYVLIKATSSLNIGKTIVNFIRLKSSSHKLRRREHYGPVQFT